MIKEDKQLLLTDLSGRLPYGVKIRIIHHEIKGADPEYVDDVFSTTHYNMIDYDDDNYEFLPYLRPMSSMTEEEKDEMFGICTLSDCSVNTDWEFVGVEIMSSHPRYGDYYSTDYSVIDWLNAHHFDYRGLIEKGLALEAPEDMY